MFLIVINIQKNRTICFQITGMPSLSFLYNICARRMVGGDLLAEQHGSVSTTNRTDWFFFSDFSFFCTKKKKGGWKMAAVPSEKPIQLWTLDLTAKALLDLSVMSEPDATRQNQKKKQMQAKFVGGRWTQASFVELQQEGVCLKTDWSESWSALSSVVFFCSLCDKAFLLDVSGQKRHTRVNEN